MNITEALKALSEGKRIRRYGLFGKPSYQIKDGVLFAGGKPTSCITFNVFDLNADNWEVVEEFYITKDEKEYLENLIRLYRDDYNFTFEKVMRNGRFYLRITLKPYSEDEVRENMLIPLICFNKPMF